MKTIAAKDKTTKSARKPSGKCKPRRPLCAYNLFFRNERNKIVLEQEHKADEAHSRRKIQAHVGFENLAKIVSKRWHNIDPAYKEELEKEAKLEKERYRKEMAGWKLEAIDEEEEVFDLEEGDDDSTTKQEGLQMTLSSNQGFRWGGGVQYFSLQHSLTSAGFNQSVLNQSFTPNYFGTMYITNPAIPRSNLLGPEASSINMARAPFIVERNPHLSHPWSMPQDSLLFPENVPTQSFQFEGRRNSMPDSFQGGRTDRMANFGFDTARQHNRRASLFSSVGETAYDDTHSNNFPPIEEIKRFFNINPKTKKVERPMFYTRQDNRRASLFSSVEETAYDDTHWNNFLLSRRLDDSSTSIPRPKRSKTQCSTADRARIDCLGRNYWGL